MPRHASPEPIPGPRGGPASRPRFGPGLALWLVLLALLAAIGFLALEACGIGWSRDGGGLIYCPAPAPIDARDAALMQERLRERALERRLDRLRLQLAAAPPCPPPPAPPLPVREEPPAAPPAPAPPPEEVAEAPDIPEEAWDDRDISLLDGCWERVTGLTVSNIETGEESTASTWRLCFGRDGSGENLVLLEGAGRCTGEARAEFLDDGRMRIEDVEDIHCPDGTYIYLGEWECERTADGEAVCTGRQRIDDDLIRFTLRRT